MSQMVKRTTTTQTRCQSITSTLAKLAGAQWLIALLKILTINPEVCACSLLLLFLNTSNIQIFYCKASFKFLQFIILAIDKLLIVKTTKIFVNLFLLRTSQLLNMVGVVHGLREKNADPLLGIIQSYHWQMKNKSKEGLLANILYIGGKSINYWHFI